MEKKTETLNMRLSDFENLKPATLSPESKVIVKVAKLMPQYLRANWEYLHNVGFEPEKGGQARIELYVEDKTGVLEMKPYRNPGLVPKDMSILVAFKYRIWFNRWIRIKVL